MDISERFVTSNKDIINYIWNIVNEYSFKDNNDTFNIRMTFYDMNYQSTTVISFSNSANLLHELPNRFKTPGMMSQELICSFIEQLLQMDYSVAKLSNDDLTIVLSFFKKDANEDKKTLNVLMSFPTVSDYSLLHDEYLNTMLDRFPTILEPLLSIKEGNNIRKRFEQEQFVFSLNCFELKRIIELLDDDDLRVLLTKLPYNKYAYLKDRYLLDYNTFRLSKKKVI